MADKRILELSLHTSLTLSDVIPIVSNNETKKTTYGSLYYGIRDGLVSGSSQIDYTQITNVPNNLISGSSQITILGFVSSSITGSSVITASFDTNTRNLTFTKGNSTQFSVNIPDVSGSSLPLGVVSGSEQITSFGFVSGSYETTGRGIVSSSAQITSFGFISSSQTIDTGSFAITGSNIFRGDQTISGSLFISGTTEFGGDLVPKVARGATLGTLDRPFRDIYLQSASINIASDIPGGRGASISNADGNVTIQAAGFQLKSGSFIAFEVSETARTVIRVPQIPAGDIGAFSIIGNASGAYQPITGEGSMVHITGNDGKLNRFNMDSFGTGSFNSMVFRTGRGTAASPLQLKANDTILRLAGAGWKNDTGFGGPSAGFSAVSIDFVSLNDQTSTTAGTQQQFYNSPLNGNVRTLSATLDASGLFVSGAFTSSLEEGYAWVGGNGNRTTLVSTASFEKTGRGILSGSISYTSLTNIPLGIVSGSSQISFNGIIDKPTLVSGSSQIDITQTSGTLDISSRTNLAVSDTLTIDMMLTGDTLSANAIGGIVSGSSQLTSSLDLRYAVTGSNVFTAGQTITGSVTITGSIIMDGTAQTYFSHTVTNPSNYVLHQFLTSSYHGGTYAFSVHDDSTGKVTIYSNYIVAQGAGHIDSKIGGDSKLECTVGSPNPTFAVGFSGGYAQFKVTDTGTFTYRGIVQIY
jgi:hypothetical protein